MTQYSTIIFSKRSIIIKKYFLFLIPVLFFFLSGCFSNSFTINLVPNEYSFYTEDEPLNVNEELIDYVSFEIYKITEEVFDNANNKNVMPDYSKEDSYYSIIFSIRFKGEKTRSKETKFLGKYANAQAYRFS